MNVTIFYFSQTGNTRKVAEVMAEAFRETGHIARTVSLKKATPHDATTGDLLAGALGVRSCNTTFLHESVVEKPRYGTVCCA